MSVSWDRRPLSAASTRKTLVHHEFSIETHNASAMSIQSKLADNSRMTSCVRGIKPRVDTGLGGRNAAVAYWLRRAPLRQRDPDATRSTLEPCRRPQTAMSGAGPLDNGYDVAVARSAAPSSFMQLYSVEMSPLWGCDKETAIPKGAAGGELAALPPLRSVTVDIGGGQHTAIAVAHQHLTFHCPVDVDADGSDSEGCSTARRHRGDPAPVWDTTHSPPPLPSGRPSQHSARSHSASRAKGRHVTTASLKKAGSSKLIAARGGGAACPSQSSLPVTAADIFQELLLKQQSRQSATGDVCSASRAALSEEELRLLSQCGHDGAK